MKPRRQNISKVGGQTISRPVTRSMTRVHRSSFPIPDELVFEIFSRLPLKSIARCRYVSKLWSEKFSFVNFHVEQCMNQQLRLGLLMAEDSSNVTQASKSFDLWVLQDAEWSKHVLVLPPTWKDVVRETMCIAGMVGTNEIVLSPRFQYVPSYVIYYYVENVKLL
ncbi:hypothetical protein Bca52824_028577 [Brassica carinata]|uniref:F-box domain-containing protein n=1 Tax=Brassica carinata TaxID=52824 RepID=A0A8X8AN22_BRACI|nr:hypothetical protein Bca52824_028577 [Brassica carinata]